MASAGAKPVSAPSRTGQPRTDLAPMKPMAYLVNPELCQGVAAAIHSSLEVTNAAR